MNKKIWLAFVIIVIASVSTFWFVRQQNTVSINADGSRSFGEYRVQTVQNTNPSFCGNDEVLDSYNKHIVTLRLCEDNIRAIKKQGDWVVVSTGMGRSYKKNLATGEETLVDAEGGVGGMSIVK